MTYDAIPGYGDNQHRDLSYQATTPGPGFTPPSTPSLSELPVATPTFIAPPPATLASFDPWNYRVDVQRTPTELHGFHVEAADGRIGKVDTSSDIKDNGFLTVDTGPWIFGRTVVIPAGSVNHIDYDGKIVYVDRTKEQVKSSPEYDAKVAEDPQRRQELHDYYRDTYK